MLFRQYLHTDPVAASYVFGCGSHAQGIVVDPLENLITFYIEEAEKLKMDIVYVIDTHLHADHISGGRELAERTGAKYILHSSAETDYPFTAVEEGEVLYAGNTKLTFIHTPGHTPEHLSVLVADETRTDDNWFVLTGHTLMSGGVGRTEIAANLEVGAADLYNSLQKLLELEDYIEVYSGAYSGSVCGQGLNGKPNTTIGFERRHNKALQFKESAAFIDFMSHEVKPVPESFSQTRKVNQGR